jgi:Serine/threonine protein kinase involved in cell cycle control
MFDSSEAEKAFGNVFDFDTGEALLKLRHRGVIETLYGVLEAGKESKVFLAESPDGDEVLVKIYMTRAGDFREMQNYLKGDRRFSSSPTSRKEVVEEWCRKEYSNLKNAADQVVCPEALGFEDNVLVMEFVGRGGRAYPKLKEVDIENPDGALEVVLDGVKRLWREEQLVHGDLSEYNVLVRDTELVWIDFSQGVHRTHPSARELLERDVENISDFFYRQGASVDPDSRAQRVSEELES